MNKSTSRIATTAALLVGAALLVSTPAIAGTVPATGVETLAIDCATKSLPSQAVVGELLGINNRSDAYNARNRLMVEVNHACRRAGTSRVQIAVAPLRKRSPNQADRIAKGPDAITRQPR